MAATRYGAALACVLFLPRAVIDRLQDTFSIVLPFGALFVPVTGLIIHKLGLHRTILL